MRTILIAVLCCIALASQSQLIEKFDDSNFINQPVWFGNDSNWQINAQHQLQSNSNVANTNFYLATGSRRANMAQWEIAVTLLFNPSSLNYTDIYLVSADSNLLQSNNTGYFVRIGSSDDDISLYRKDVAGPIKIIDGINGILNSSNNQVTCKVTRNENNRWELIRTINSNTLFYEGLAFDSTYRTSSCFGIVVKQSTASFFQKHFFDDIKISDYVRDSTPPEVDTIIPISNHAVDILFNEPVEKNSAEAIAHYSINNIGNPSSAKQDSANPSLVHLNFSAIFSTRTIQQIHIDHIQDRDGNECLQGDYDFILYAAEVFDIIIDEVMADPTPSNGLPEVEWIEIKNNSPFDINLSGWKLGKPGDVSGAMPPYLLKRDSFLVICGSSSLAALQSYSSAISVANFPSLNNISDLLYLLSPDNKTIHAVEYSDDWYQNELKKQGGWSLEMMDVNSPCLSVENWTASISSLGASPGKINSVDDINVDVVSPKLLRAYATDSTHIKLIFNEPLDSLIASNPLCYDINENIGKPNSVSVESPLFNHVNLLLHQSLKRNRTYSISVSGVVDCIQNSITSHNNSMVGLYESADSLDLVVNEILFNPKPYGYDYVELYNRSNKIINLKNIYLANFNPLNTIDNITPLTSEDYLFFPNTYIVLTENPKQTTQNYFVPNPESILRMQNMPSFGDDDGVVVLLNEQGKIIDRVSYREEWHFKLLDNTEGVALERLNSEGNSQDEKNWHSASSSVGFGTPTYKNSQSILSQIVDGEINLIPKIISPNNDGVDDYTTIQYSFSEPGNVCSITLFDAAGRTLRRLEINKLCGREGFFIFDGLDSKGQKLPTGAYLIFSEVYNVNGKTGRFKNLLLLK